MTDTLWHQFTADSDAPHTTAVACIGETMVSFIPSAGAALDAAATVDLDVAGAESNVAMYLADHRIDARWISKLGDDAFGRRVLDRVSACGVDVSGVLIDPDRPTGLLFKDPGQSADGGTTVTYRRAGSAASALGPDALDLDAARTASLWHLTGITPALSPSCRALVEAALDAPRPAVSFDVNFRPAVWRARAATDPTHSADPANPADLLLHYAQSADIVFVGLDEAQVLWGERLTQPEDVRALLPDPRILVVKDGATAATAFCAGLRVVVPALKVKVVEPVGAGDAFAAGFLAALLQGRSVTHCLRSGHLTAAAALSVPGDHGPLPPREEFARRLAASAQDWGR
jgi:2-dehydro-3-deoxygluconokinase